jgi:hypothetical protein
MVASLLIFPPQKCTKEHKRRSVVASLLIFPPQKGTKEHKRHRMVASLLLLPQKGTKDVEQLLRSFF